MADLNHEQLDEWRRFFADRIHDEADRFPVGCYALIDMARRALHPEALQTYQRGDRVLVAWPSGHLEECVVEDTVVWVKDETGHAHECGFGQLSKINDSSTPQMHRSCPDCGAPVGAVCRHQEQPCMKPSTSAALMPDTKESK